MLNKDNQAIENLKKYKILVDKQLASFFKIQTREARKVDQSSFQMMKAIEEFTLRGGKRIRAALIFYGYQCFSSRNLKEVIKSSMAIEMIQSYLLIHDDIVDRDDKRRGGKTMHKVYEQIGGDKFNLKKNIVEREHFGRSMAIFSGNICASLANIILSESNFKNKNVAIQKVNEIITQVNFGQIVDFFSGYKKTFSEKEILKIYKLKTGSYTFEAPLIIGAVLAGAHDSLLQPFKKYAQYLGLAFNIQDDILELFGEEKKTGKPSGSDLKEGKKVLMIVKAMELASSKDKNFIKKNLGNKNLKKKEIERFKKIITDTGSLDYCKKKAQLYINKAKLSLKKANYKKKGRDFLEGIADYMLERKY